jgi:glyoxylase-like metal-dependent hydrolase (beta-lactamase superfamily II)
MVTGAGMFADAPPSLMIKFVGFLMNITGLDDFETFTPDILFENNQSLKKYGLDATVIHTPGHSKGSISAFTLEGDLFCGDIFNGSIEGVTTIIDDQTSLARSVDQIKRLKVETFYPGHGKPFHS